MSPSTIFKQNYNGDRQSPWGPPTRSMTKKKGWVEPEKPLNVKFSKPEMRRVPDSNELLQVGYIVAAKTTAKRYNEKRGNLRI